MNLSDTNILIEFYKGNSDVVGTLQKIGLHDWPEIEKGFIEHAMRWEPA